jgi:hypothetical protein
MVPINQTTRLHIPEDNLHNHRCENLKSQEELIIAVNVCNTFQREKETPYFQITVYKCSVLYNVLYAGVRRWTHAEDLLSWILGKDMYCPRFRNISGENYNCGVII